MAALKITGDPRTPLGRLSADHTRKKALPMFTRRSSRLSSSGSKRLGGVSCGGGETDGRICRAGGRVPLTLLVAIHLRHTWFRNVYRRKNARGNALLSRVNIP